MFDSRVIDPSEVSSTSTVVYVFILVYFFVFIVVLAHALAYSSRVETDVEWGVLRHSMVLFEVDEAIPPAYDEVINLSHPDIFVVGDDSDDED
jgi:hypothetical protein